MTLAEREHQLLDRLMILPDPQERLSALVALAAHAPPLLECERIEANRVRGCVSNVWLVGTCEEARCCFRSEADSPLVAGLVGLLCELSQGAEARDLEKFTPTIFHALGLWDQLSPTRQNGLRCVQETMRHFASSCL